MPDEPAPPAKPKKKLNRREERLARLSVKKPQSSLAELGAEAGYEGTKRVVESSTWRAMNKPHVKDRIQELLNTDPATSLDGLHKTLKDGLEAKDTKFFAHEGKVKSQRTTVDHVTRHKYLETALELHGAKEKQNGGVVNNFFTREAIETFVAAFKRGGPSA